MIYEKLVTPTSADTSLGVSGNFFNEHYIFMCVYINNILKSDCSAFG